MAAIVSVIAVVLISMLINRFATIALSLTGMSREEARFQARAAMTSGDQAVTPLTPKRPPSELRRGDRAVGVGRSADAANRRDQVAESPPLRAHGVPMLRACSTPNQRSGRPGARW